MSAQHSINVDLAKVFASKEKKDLITILGWGDDVEVVPNAEDHVEIKATRYDVQPDGSVKPVEVPGFIFPSKSVKTEDIIVPKTESKVLKIDFVDVQQGDGSVIESPQGNVILIDGGDNQMFARYLANRFPGSTDQQPQEIECILVTHGDADHFLGLTKIHESETEARLAKQPWKRLFIHPKRVYHNGLVKRPEKINGKDLKETEMLGPIEVVKDPVTNKDVTLITGLEEDLLGVDPTQMNEPFKAWQRALQTFRKRGPITFRRLQRGAQNAFDFLSAEKINVEVFGPIPERIGNVEGLRFLGNPPEGPRVGQESLLTAGEGFSGKSASHTINGHSVIFRLTYGGFNFLFTGDLNDQSGQVLTREHNEGRLNLQAEVFKVPHHGSADFSGAFVQAVAPVVSIVSSGDENARKEFIHPRATLMGALGKHSRVEEPLIFVTELVAFFEVVGRTLPERHKMKDDLAVVKDGLAVVDETVKRTAFFAFRRAAFGLVMVRSDGNRMLVYTNSGQVKMKEAYAFQLDKFGKPEPAEVRQV